MRQIKNAFLYLFGLVSSLFFALWTAIIYITNIDDLSGASPQIFYFILGFVVSIAVAVLFSKKVEQEKRFFLKTNKQRKVKGDTMPGGGYIYRFPSKAKK